MEYQKIYLSAGAEVNRPLADKIMLQLANYCNSTGASFAKKTDVGSNGAIVQCYYSVNGVKRAILEGIVAGGCFVTEASDGTFYVLRWDGNKYIAAELTDYLYGNTNNQWTDGEITLSWKGPPMANVVSCSSYDTKIYKDGVAWYTMPFGNSVGGACIMKNEAGTSYLVYVRLLMTSNFSSPYKRNGSNGDQFFAQELDADLNPVGGPVYMGGDTYGVIADVGTNLFYGSNVTPWRFNKAGTRGITLRKDYDTYPSEGVRKYYVDVDIEALTVSVTRTTDAYRDGNTSNETTSSGSTGDWSSSSTTFSRQVTHFYDWDVDDNEIEGTITFEASTTTDRTYLETNNTVEDVGPFSGEDGYQVYRSSTEAFSRICSLEIALGGTIVFSDNLLIDYSYSTSLDTTTTWSGGASSTVIDSSSLISDVDQKAVYIAALDLRSKSIVLGIQHGVQAQVNTAPPGNVTENWASTPRRIVWCNGKIIEDTTSEVTKNESYVYYHFGIAHNSSSVPTPSSSSTTYTDNFFDSTSSCAGGTLQGAANYDSLYGGISSTQAVTWGATTGPWLNSPFEAGQVANMFTKSYFAVLPTGDQLFYTGPEWPCSNFDWWDSQGKPETAILTNGDALELTNQIDGSDKYPEIGSYLEAEYLNLPFA